VFINMAEILDVSPITNFGVGLSKTYSEGVWPDTATVTVIVAMKERSKNKWAVDIRTSWPSSMYGPVDAMRCSHVIQEAVRAATRCYTCSVGYTWTKKQCEDAIARLENYGD
jgi:hypothetical protein